MNMSRRTFMGTILAAAVAPAVVHFESLMPIVVRPRRYHLFAHSPFDLQEIVTVRPITYSLQAFWLDERKNVNALTPRFSTVTEYRYVAQELELTSFGNHGRPKRVYADGEELPPSKYSITPDGGLLIRDFDLTEYGCHLPNFEIEA